MSPKTSLQFFVFHPFNTYASSWASYPQVSGYKSNMFQTTTYINSTGVITLPTQTINIKEIPQNYHTFAWFDSRQNGKFNDPWSIPTFFFVCRFSFLAFAHVPLQQWKGSAAWRSKGVMRPVRPGLYCGMFSFRFFVKGGFFSQDAQGSYSRKPKLLHILLDQLWVSLTYISGSMKKLHTLDMLVPRELFGIILGPFTMVLHQKKSLGFLWPFHPKHTLQASPTVMGPHFTLKFIDTSLEFSTFFQNVTWFGTTSYVFGRKRRLSVDLVIFHSAICLWLDVLVCQARKTCWDWTGTAFLPSIWQLQLTCFVQELDYYTIQYSSNILLKLKCCFASKTCHNFANMYWKMRRLY